MRVRLKGIHRVKARLADGTIREYHYAWRGGPRLEGKPGSPEYVTAYSEAHKNRKRPPEGVFFSLISLYRESAEFTTKLAPKSQKEYGRYLRMIEDEFGDMPLAALEDPRVRGDFKAWRGSMADRPRTADFAWTILARVLSVAKDRGKIAINPCERGGRLYDADRTDRLWSEELIARFLSVASDPLRLAIIAALWTGQRRGDLLRLQWSAYDGTHIRLRQGKGGRRVVIL